MSYLCLCCVSNWIKGVVSTAECGGAHGGGKEGGWATWTILRECRKYRDERGQKAQLSEDLQTLMFGQLCLTAL